MGLVDIIGIFISHRSRDSHPNQTANLEETRQTGRFGSDSRFWWLKRPVGLDSDRMPLRSGLLLGGTRRIPNYRHLPIVDWFFHKLCMKHVKESLKLERKRRKECTKDT